MLWRWRLTPTETLRAMAAVAFGIGANVAAVIWWVWFVFRVSDAASGPNPLAAYGFLWMFITGVEPAVWLRLTIRLRKPTEPDCLAARIVAPRQAELYDRLIGSLERFEEEHYPGERMPLTGRQKPLWLNGQSGVLLSRGLWVRIPRGARPQLAELREIGSGIL